MTLTMIKVNEFEYSNIYDKVFCINLEVFALTFFPKFPYSSERE